MSAARIGRSLGVHLVLATQKPSGVVSDQIRSNMRLKVCLKVADAADSKEMIGRPDAADIPGPGRFYMLVGYNEHFLAGQAAYAGAPYAPVDVWPPRVDDAVDAVDERLDVTASVKKRRETRAADGVEEINAVLEGVREAASGLPDARAEARPLWLAPLPAHIGLAELEQSGMRGLVAEAQGASSYISILGEVDIPERQTREAHLIDWCETGNLAIYGAPGTGTSELAVTALVSMAKRLDASRLEIYAIDLEGGALSALLALPQCGGVARGDDAEHMENLFRLLETSIASRRELLSAGEQDELSAMPRIFLAISGIAAFYELFPMHEDRLGALARDGSRLGVHMIITAASATAARMRLRSSFPEVIALAMNDESDYATLFGHKPSVTPARSPGRGIVKHGKDLCEFQAANVASEDGSVVEELHGLADDISAGDPVRATPIPVLPARVGSEEVLLGKPAGAALPVGFSKETVAPLWIPLDRAPCLLALGDDATSLSNYVRAALGLLVKDSSASFLALDPERALGEISDSRIAQSPEEMLAGVQDVISAESTPALLVLISAVRVMDALPAEIAKGLQSYIETERFSGATAVMAVSEAWRVRSLYDRWFKVLSAYGSGIWVGNGFCDQSMLRPAQMRPEWRRAIRSDEGFATRFGVCDPVRLISPNETDGNE